MASSFNSCFTGKPELAKSPCPVLSPILEVEMSGFVCRLSMLPVTRSTVSEVLKGKLYNYSSTAEPSYDTDTFPYQTAQMSYYIHWCKQENKEIFPQTWKKGPLSASISTASTTVTLDNSISPFSFPIPSCLGQQTKLSQDKSHCELRVINQVVIIKLLM